MNKDLIHDWNVDGGASPDPPPTKVLLDDETLRDGLQSPSVQDPPIEVKKRILHLIDRLGIDTANIGLPGAGPRAAADVEALCREIVDAKLDVRPNCAARTVIRDIEPILRAADNTGLPVEACVFIGSSPIRMYAETWDEDFLLARSEEAITYAIKGGVPVMFVTEDTTRARPEHDPRQLYTAAIEARSAKRICICDTVGHATPGRPVRPCQVRLPKGAGRGPAGPTSASTGTVTATAAWV